MIKINYSSKAMTVDGIWFALLVVYIVMGYFAQDVLLPSSISSLSLYTFLGFSLLAIIYSRRIKLSPIITWEILCLILAFIAMLYSPSFSILGGTYYALIVNAILVFIFSQMPWTKERFNLVMKAYAFSGAGLIIALALTGNLQDSSDSGRLGQELMGIANILATMLMVSAIYVLWLIVSSKAIYARLLYVGVLITIYIGMFLSGGRKYIIVPLIFIYVLLICKQNERGRKHTVRYTLLIFVLFVALYQLVMKVPALYDTIGYRFEGAFALFDDSYEMDGSTLNRKMMIEAGFKGWLERPIFGHGFDSFKYYNAAEVTGNMYYSHNNFIELLYNQGVVGFIAYYGMYLYLLIKAFKSNAQSINKGFVYGLIASFMFYEYFAISYSVTPSQLMVFFALCICRDTQQSNSLVEQGEK